MVSTLLQTMNAHRLLLSIVVVVVLFMGLMAIVVPPVVDYDSCWGFVEMRHMEQGNLFNLLIMPDPDNIANNRTEFLTWWTPGQYYVPYVIKILLKVSTGQAASLSVIICNLIGLAGFYKLFTTLGFSRWVAAISIAFISTQQLFFQQFVYYHGGETMIFAIMGWFLYACFIIERITWQVLAVMFIAGPVGFFSKSAFLWIYVAGIASLWINVSINQTSKCNRLSKGKLLDYHFNKRIRAWIANGMLLVLPVACALFVIYCFFLSKGPNPTTETGQIFIKPETFIFPLASPLVSSFSLDDIFGGLISQVGGRPISYNMAIVILFVLSLCSLAFLAVMIKTQTDKKYTVAITVFYVIGVTFFSLMYLQQANISYEGRHFRLLGLLAIPGLIRLLFKKKLSKYFFVIVWIGLTLINVSYFIRNYRLNRLSAKGQTGFSQPLYDKATLSEIAMLDKASPASAVFVVMKPSIAMEIEYKRLIIIDSDTMSGTDFFNLKYTGKTGAIYIIMPSTYVKSGRSLIITKSFASYHRFIVKQLSSNYYLYSATD